MAGLTDLAQIAKYVGKTSKTTLKMIRNENLPATKVGGAWVSDTLLIDRWRQWKVVLGTNSPEHLHSELVAAMQQDR